MDPAQEPRPEPEAEPPEWLHPNPQPKPQPQPQPDLQPEPAPEPKPVAEAAEAEPRPQADAEPEPEPRPEAEPAPGPRRPPPVKQPEAAPPAAAQSPISAISQHVARRGGLERGLSQAHMVAGIGFGEEVAGSGAAALVAMRVPEEQRTEQHTQELLRWVNSIRFFRDSTTGNAMRKRIGSHAEAMEVPKGHVICRQGDPGDAFYVVLTGQVEVVVNGHVVGALDPGQGFGDRALSTTMVSRRTASVLTTKPSALARIDAATYHTVISETSQAEMSKFGGLFTMGQVEFAAGRRVRDVDAPTLKEAAQAKVIRLETPDSDDFAELNPEAQLQRVKMLRDVVDVMKYTWRIPMPNVIFSVTGGATEFKLQPKIARTFEQTLLNATRSTKGWIVTGGSNSGVMKLVGDSIAQSGRMETCLGIIPWGVVHGRDCFTKDGKAQQQLKKDLPAMTVRVDGIPAVLLDEEAAIAEQFSRFGTVVGVTTNMKVPSSAEAVASERSALNGEGWAYVSFADAATARIACDHRLKLKVDALEKVDAPVIGRPYDSKDDPGLYALHEGRVLSSRGTVSLPFQYTGENIPEEGKMGAQLDSNHSHYILLDDATQNRWGREVAFRGEMLDFLSYRYDVSGLTMESIAEQIRNRQHEYVQRKRDEKSAQKWKQAVGKIGLVRALGVTDEAAASEEPPNFREPTSKFRSWEPGWWEKQDLQRSIPVVCVVYNGGPNTMATVMLHVDYGDPVIIIRGSGRAADLFAEWKGLMDETKTRQVAASQDALIKHWLFNDELVPQPSTPQGETELKARMEQFRDILNKICGYSLFKTVDVRESVNDTLSDLGTNNPLLGHVLSAIFDSSTVKSSAKLPLAIKYNDRLAVRQVLDQQGVHMLSPSKDLAADARALV